MSKVLVTGAAGFLGVNLVKRLLDKGYYVVGMDDMSTGSKRNIQELNDYSINFQFYRHDVVDSWPNIYGVKQIYNLACPASPPKYQMDPVKTFKTSVFGVYNGLLFAQQSGARFLQASTSEIYGDPVVHPQNESYWGNVNPIGIRSNYDEGKRAAETLITDFSKQYGVTARIARIFNTYGPGMDPNDGRVVSNFIMQAIQGKDITIYGSGNQTRSFCYVDDLISGLIALMNSDVEGPVNIGNPGEFNMHELAEKVLQKTGSASKVVYNPLPGDDPKVRRPDITRAQELLGWTPSISLDEGLDKTIDYFKTIFKKVNVQ